MNSAKYIYWQEGEAWIGYLQEFPDYWTQGESKDDLIAHLQDLFIDLSGGLVPGVRRIGELTVS